MSIPKDLREKHGLEEDGKFAYINLGYRISLLHKPRDPIEALKKINIEMDKSIQDIK
jgi:hypothetical protein